MIAPTKGNAEDEQKLAVSFALADMVVVPVCGYTISGNYTGTTNYVSKSGNDANNGKS